MKYRQKSNERVYVRDYKDEHVEMVVMALLDKIAALCSPMEKEAAEKNGREPNTLGFRYTDIERRE